MKSIRKCVNYCPSGYFSEKSKTCVKCHSDCFECTGPTSFDCLICQKGLKKIDTNECVEKCSDEDGYFISLWEFSSLYLKIN